MVVNRFQLGYPTHFISVCAILSITDVALVDGWRDNHVLIFYTNIYCRYTEHTNELQLDDLKVAGWSIPFARLALRVSSSLSVVCWVKVKVKVTLRLAVYRQSVRLGVKPLETHDQIFFFQLNSCDNSPYVASSLTRRWVCLSRICLVFRRVYISHI
jgi:hypothetical protein